MPKETPLDCPQLVELLPWLLNGTLESVEATRARAHLETCRSCRDELGETRWAAAVLGAHVPAEVLVALAWERPEADMDPDLARRHLESCPSCAEELSLARESRRLESAPELRPVPRPIPLALRYGSLAAALFIGFGAGAVALRLWPSRPMNEQAQRLPARVGELEEQVRRLRESESALQGEVRRLEAPEPDLPVIEVLPDSSVSRSGKVFETRVAIPKGSRLVALVLGSEKASGRAEVELRNARGEVIWTGRDLQPSRLGGYTLGLPASMLTEERYTLALRPARGASEAYSLRVEHAR